MKRDYVNNRIVRRLGLACLLCVAGAGGSARGASFLIKDGKAHADIVVSDKPARMAKLAATELQSYLRKITGAELAIVTVPGTNVSAHIYVGKSPQIDRLKLSADGLAHGAFRMVSGSDWLALFGPDKDFVPIEPWPRSRDDVPRVLREWDAISGSTFATPYSQLYRWLCPELDIWMLDDAGTLNAVHEFLRNLGVRWYFPGELGEIVPRTADVALPALDRTVRPDFPLRSVMWWGMQRGMPKDEVLWSLRLGINYGPELLGLTQNCHGMKFVTTRQEIKDAHPEYYALWNGKRAIDHRECGAPCLSSEGLFNLHLKYARAILDHYREPLISLDVCDGYGYGMCRCDLCKGKGTPDREWNGSMADYVWGYIDRAARELHKTHPDRRFSGLAYSAYLVPPATIDQFSPNLAVLLCQTRSTFHDVPRRDFYRGLRKQWLDKLPSKELYIFDYYLHNEPGRSTEGIPTYFTRLIADDLRSLKGVSRGDTLDAYRPSDPTNLAWHAQAIMHLNHYVTSRFWWDAGQDLDALLDEYFTLFYGPARAEMKAFVMHAETNWPKMSESVALIDESLALLDKARQAAGDGIYARRVDLQVAYLQPLHLLRKQLSKNRGAVPETRALERNSAFLALDGKIDDPKFWDVRACQLVDAASGKRARQPTTFWTAMGKDEALYLGIRCGEPDMAGLSIASTNSGDAAILEGDVIEVLIETPIHSFYRIAVNPAGARLERDGAPEGAVPRWASSADVAVHRGADHWSVEMKLPAAGDLAREIHPERGIAGRRASPTYPWYMNVCRQRVRNGQLERSAWSPAGTNRWDDALMFGRVWAK